MCASYSYTTPRCPVYYAHVTMSVSKDYTITAPMNFTSTCSSMVNGDIMISYYTLFICKSIH